MATFKYSRSLIGDRPWIVKAGTGKDLVIYSSESWNAMDPSDQAILNDMDVRLVQNADDSENGSFVFSTEKSIPAVRLEKINGTNETSRGRVTAAPSGSDSFRSPVTKVVKAEDVIARREMEKLARRRSIPWIFKLPVNVVFAFLKLLLFLSGIALSLLGSVIAFLKPIWKIFVFVAAFMAYLSIFGGLGMAPGTASEKESMVAVFIIFLIIYFVPEICVISGEFLMNLNDNFNFL